MGKWDWLVQDAPVDPVTGGEYDAPRHDGAPVGIGCLMLIGLALVGGVAILGSLIL